MSLAINLTVVQIQDLSLYYAEKAAFQNINLAIPKHSITALIGPSGCGKTSFLNCLDRLVELTPKTKIT